MIYTIIRHKSVHVRKLQVAILAQSFREMSLTDRILPRYILSRVRFGLELFTREKTANQSRPHTDLRPPQSITAQQPDKQLNWKRRNPSSSVAQREELSAKTLLKLVRSAAIRVQNPCGGNNIFFTVIVCDYQGLLLINPRNIISNIIMIFNINSTRGQTRFLTCVARVTCLVVIKNP